MKTIHHDGSAITVTLPNGTDILIETWVSELDDVPVVQIDTVTDTGRLRVNMNDAPIWDADPDRTNSDTSVVDAIAALMSGAEWNADTLDTIAGLVRSVGRTIDDTDSNPS